MCAPCLVSRSQLCLQYQESKAQAVRRQELLRRCGAQRVQSGAAPLVCCTTCQDCDRSTSKIYPPYPPARSGQCRRPRPDSASVPSGIGNFLLVFDTFGERKLLKPRRRANFIKFLYCFSDRPQNQHLNPQF